MIEIQELGPSDYDRMIEIWDRTELSHRPNGRDQRERVVREMAGSCSVFLGAREDGVLVGVVLGTHDGRKGWINRLAILPEHRHRGIGTALVRAVEERLHSMGIEIITCLIDDWNENSMQFFEVLGYVDHRECIYYSKRLRPDI